MSENSTSVNKKSIKGIMLPIILNTLLFDVLSIFINKDN